MRTPAAHEAHCAGLRGPLHEHISTTFGVTRDALLNSCRYFHVLHGLVPDEMHDLLEGSLPLVTKLLLVHYIQGQRLFSLADLNSRILPFKYGSAVKNKPSAITASSLASNDAKLRQSGMSQFSLYIFVCIIAFLFLHHQLRRCGV